MKIGDVPGWNVDKKPQGGAAEGFVNLHMEPAICKKLKTLSREMGRMSMPINC